MNARIKVLEAVGQLGLGGTEYALQLYSKYLDKKRFDVKVVALYRGGERVKQIEELGIEVFIIENNFDLLENLVKDTDVIHWHGSGIPDEPFFKVIQKNKPKLVIQTNVFGWYSKESAFNHLIDFDLYISKMILVRRMQLDQNLEPSKRKFLSYPVDVDFLLENAPSENDILSFKNQYSLNHQFLVGRIGRASDSKFDLITFDGFKEFLKYQPDSCFILVGATDLMIAYINYLGIGKNVRILPNTIELKRLLVYYSAMDTFIAASSIGESFGMVMAEAMTMGTPVLTIHTPKRDNAQIELVENMETGIVVPRLKNNIALGLKEINENLLLAEKFSQNSIAKVKREFDAHKVVESLQNLIFKELGQEQSVVDSILYDWSTGMADEYEAKCLNLYGGLNSLGRLKIKVFDTFVYQIIRKIFLKIITSTYSKKIKQ